MPAAEERHPLRRIAMITPHPWTIPHPVNDHIADLADGFVQLREQAAQPTDIPEVVVIAPATGRTIRRATRRALRDLSHGIEPEDVFAARKLQAPSPGSRRGSAAAHDWPLIALGLPAGSANVALRASLRIVLERGGIDLLHVHDPVENDLTRTATRRFHGLSIATFHDEPTPTVLGALTAPLRQRVLDAIDRWIAPDATLAQKLAETFDQVALDDVTVMTCAAAGGETPGAGAGPVVVIGRGAGDDALLRSTIRDLLPLLEQRSATAITLLARYGALPRPTTPRAARGRFHVVDARTRDEADAVLAGAGVFLALPATPQRSIDEARAAGVPVLTIDIDDDAAVTLTERVIACLDAPGAPSDLPTRTQLATSLLDLARESRSRIQVHIPAPPAAARGCVIDLHMHTNHSWDCATDPAALLHVAREVGLTAIAVTDHNEISGALACAELADEYGMQVIVGEEIKTSQGEVIGLFLSERIEPSLPWGETLELIRAQDGLVYVPHPFDRLHTIPDVHTLRDTIDEIDAFEVYNARLPFDQYNRDAQRFASKYNLVEGAGSDSHVVQGLGTAAVHMPAWDDPESFLLALRQGEILRRPKSLLYLQSLKWVNDLTGRSKPIPDEAVGRAR